MTTNHPKQIAYETSGFTMVIGLIYLLLITMLGMAAMQNAILDEKALGADLDRNYAFQLAEMTLRDAEQDIFNLTSTGSPCITEKCRWKSDYALPSKANLGDSLLTKFTAETPCIKGVCYFAEASHYLPNGQPVPNVASAANKSNGDSPYVFWQTHLDTGTEYGTYTGAKKIDDAPQPRYWIEVVRAELSKPNFYFYRITALAFGKRADTRVVLQTIIDPNQ